MFARIFRVALKPGQSDLYARAIEQKVIPVLKKFSGIRDEIGGVRGWKGRDRDQFLGSPGRRRSLQPGGLWLPDRRPPQR